MLNQKFLNALYRYDHHPVVEIADGMVSVAAKYGAFDVLLRGHKGTAFVDLSVKYNGNVERKFVPITTTRESVRRFLCDTWQAMEFVHQENVTDDGE